MRTSCTLGVLAIVAATLTVPARAAVIFQDDFEAGTLGNWTATGSSPLDISTDQNAVPVGGAYSVLLNNSLDRMHHNIVADNGGVELAGPSTFTSWIYDPGTGATAATRVFNEVRGYAGGTGLPNGGTTASGTLEQLLAIGKYNTVTRVGEVYSGTRYQARMTFPSTNAQSGWFNLDGPGAPTRSVGWHRFDIERLADGTTINFYVDGILSETVTGAGASTWDTVVLGGGLGSTVGDAYIDGVSITNTLVPEPSSLALMGLGGLALLARRRKA